MPAGAFATATIDSALVAVGQRIKSLVIVVTSAITSAAAQQATVQLFAARSPFAVSGASASPTQSAVNPSGQFNGGSGVGSQFPVSGNNAAQLVGPAVALAGSTNSIPTGVYWFTSTSPGNPSASPPTSMTELTQFYPALGVEIHAPSAFTAGAALAFFELAPL